MQTFSFKKMILALLAFAMILAGWLHCAQAGEISQGDWPAARQTSVERTTTLENLLQAYLNPQEHLQKAQQNLEQSQPEEAQKNIRAAQKKLGPYEKNLQQTLQQAHQLAPTQPQAAQQKLAEALGQLESNPESKETKPAEEPALEEIAKINQQRKARLEEAEQIGLRRKPSPVAVEKDW